MSVRVAWKGFAAALLALSLAPVAAVRGEDLLVEDFSGGDGGFSVNNVGAVEHPWAYAAGSWSTGGSQDLGSPTSSSLVSPTLTATVGGPATLSFSHRYSFEKDSVIWDAGAVQISVNGAAFATLPGSAFSANGYGGVVEGNNALTGQNAFVGNSAGYDAGALITSVADLGTLSAGDTISVAFLGAWDEFARGSDPNWVVDSVSVTTAPIPEPGTLALGLIAMAAIGFQVRRRAL